MKEDWYVLPARQVGRALRAIEARAGAAGGEPAAPEPSVLLVLMPERLTPDEDPEA